MPQELIVERFEHSTGRYAIYLCGNLLGYKITYSKFWVQIVVPGNTRGASRTSERGRKLEQLRRKMESYRNQFVNVSPASLQ
jgi:hypothetical protein